MNLTFINTVQTALSVANVALIALLAQVGCVDDPLTPSTELVCTAASIPWLPLWVLLWAAGISNFLKLFLIPWLSPGGWVHNLFGARAAVVPVNSPASVPGTVSPTAVK